MSRLLPVMQYCQAALTLWKRVLSITLACMAVAGTVLAEESTNTPTAAELMDKVLSGMPQTPIHIRSRVAVKTGSKRTIMALRLHITLCITPTNATGKYVFADNADEPFAELNVTRTVGKRAVYDYKRGSPMQPASMPALSEPAEGTDIAWMDLAMPFLWWRDGEIVDSDTTRGRDCWVVVLRPPAGEAGYEGSVKVWIDKKFFMVLRAEQFNPKSEKTRYMVVESFKKINEEWMIKDIIVKRTDTRASTVITVIDMEAE